MEWLCSRLSPQPPVVPLATSFGRRLAALQPSAAPPLGPHLTALQCAWARSREALGGGGGGGVRAARSTFSVLSPFFSFFFRR